MIPQNVLSKLATKEGIQELSDCLTSAESNILCNAIVFRGGATEHSLKQREEATVRVAQKEGSLRFRVEMPSEGEGTSMTVVEVSIPVSAYLHIQKTMHEVYLTGATNDPIQLSE